MPFCPNCKEEYREGIKICPDCNCALTETLVETVPPVISIRSESVLNRFIDYLSYSGISVTVTENEFTQKFDVFCDSADTDRIKRAFAVFVAVETGNMVAANQNTTLQESTELTELDDMDELTIPEDWEEALEEDGLTDENEQDLRELLSEDAVAELTAPAFLHTAKTPTQYVSAEEKRVDTRESGITLIAVGLIVAVIDVIYYFSSFSNLYAAIVMGVMALAMICYGVHSLFKSNELIAVAAAEEQTKEEIHGFLADALSKERILEAVPDDSADGPELDLLRQQYCLDRVKEHFPNVDEALLLYLSDEWYNDLFESDSEVPEDTDSI